MRFIPVGRTEKMSSLEEWQLKQKAALKNIICINVVTFILCPVLYHLLLKQLADEFISQLTEN